MEQAGAVVTSVETALFELLGGAGSDEFKAIQKLILEYAPNPGAEARKTPHERAGMSCWRTAPGSTASWSATPAGTGEVVFNTSMTGYQEASPTPPTRARSSP